MVSILYKLVVFMVFKQCFYPMSTSQYKMSRETEIVIDSMSTLSQMMLMSEYLIQ